jgi:hypothetical protein
MLCWRKLFQWPGLVAAFQLTLVTAGAVAAERAPVVPAAPMIQRVQIYASPTTRARLTATGMDASESVRTWEVFLRKYKIPYQSVVSVEQLEKLQPGVLLLPSAIALTEREKQAVIDFRAKGGGVLSTWMTGVQNEAGESRGYSFMQDALDVKVVGNTEEQANDIWLIPHGDNPVTHNLPAGLRIWLDRVKPWYPLRLVGAHPAANIMNWGRTVVPEKPSTTITFDERIQPTGRLSRSVVFGYPERLWVSADPKMLEAIAHNTLMWLLRQPDVYVTAWPHPYSSAFVLAVDSVDPVAEVDLNFARQFEDTGGRATYYVLSEVAQESAEILKKIQARGHEVAFHGDRFKGFTDQSTAEQAKRLDTMQRELKAAGVDIAVNPGFHAPMEQYDKTTEKLLKERSFGHYVSSMDASETGLPFFAPGGAGIEKSANRLVVLPRTLGGPEDEDRNETKRIKEFLNELGLVNQMAGLAVVRIPNQSALGEAELGEFFGHLKTLSNGMWMATGGQVSEWWRERDRVSVNLESNALAPLLKVTISGDKPLRQAVTVWVNLPESRAAVRLVSRNGYAKLPKVVRIDDWRNAVVLDGFAAGEYQWYLYFDKSAVDSGK